MKKKSNLFKVIGIVLLAYCVLSWIIPAVSSVGGDVSSATRQQVSVIGVFLAPFESFSVFSGIIIFIVLVGAFYAILEETGVYNKLLETLAGKIKGKENIALIVIMVIIAIISSIVGLEVGMFFVFPFIISLVLLLGYDKLTALSATVGATVIGIYGSTLSGIFHGFSSQFIDISLYDGIAFKVILFVVGLALLLLFTLKHADKVKGTVKNELKKVEVKEEVKEEKEERKETKNKKDNKKAIKKDSKKAEKKIVSKKERKSWPILLVAGLVLLVLLLGSIDWEGLGVSAFTKFDEWFRGIDVFGFALFDKLFNGITAFGTWTSQYRFSYYAIILILASLIIAIIYKIGPSRYFEALGRGFKDYFIPAVLVALAYTLFVLVYYYPVYNTIATWVMGISSKFNVAVTGLYSMLSSFFYVDSQYYFAYTLQYLQTIVTDANTLSLVNVMLSNLYGLVMLIAPTSVLLLISLVKTEVSYKEWLKYIWKLFLALFVVSFVVFMIMLLV